MIGLIWIIWIVNILFVQIVLFNFLIAIVGDSYSTVTTDRVLHMFTHRCDLNREAQLMTSAKGSEEFEMLIIMAKDDGITQNHLEWMETINKLKVVVAKKREEVNKDLKEAIDQKFSVIEQELRELR